MRVLVIDSYDSFTFNLCQQIGMLGAEPIVVKSDTPYDRVSGIACDRIVLSPGPGNPRDSSLYLSVLAGMSRRIPTLGVCLGHQAIGLAFGAAVRRADRVMHGRTSQIRHDGRTVYAGITNPLTATRYHSLIIDHETVPEALEVTARTLDDGCVMGVRHAEYPIEGVQFHPESILTAEGGAIMRNFLYGNGGGAAR
ncbi:MAG: aminodeoxychorismate/anthranilate synthase component II [Methanomicrobiaceae archaeon]|uniref:Anthranilate synthase, amidotransferase component n=1 Tax=hydrocarbon metagenome TaxID=938273 RepID=A0A0W8FJD0_9ZZZZ|nr:aminodeoxychorismate/anthranilate synthase component II [Methanomicrobiaceae archaeon]MDD5419195.1 aminodeoxychorismate/anthranilate synthase component II [Methanomicrobiaceae archaeon]